MRFLKVIQLRIFAIMFRLSMFYALSWQFDCSLLWGSHNVSQRISSGHKHSH